MIDPIFCKRFPYHTLSDAQLAIYTHVRHADKSFLLISRQVGKSNLLSAIWWKRIIEDGKVGETYITLSPRSGDVEKLMLNDILLEAFGGAKLVHDLNAIYIKPPTKWLEPVMQEHEALEKTDEQHKSLWSIYLKQGFIKVEDDDIYVKLFFEDISQTGSGKRENYFSGVLFNGATILCLGATHTLSSQIRGKKFAGNYGEEMGEYPEEPFSALLPAITSQRGWMMYAGTPNKNNPLNWLYQQYEEVKNSPNCEKFTDCGVDFYKTKLERRIPNSQENILKGDPEFIVDGYNTTVWCIGDIEKIFPFVHRGAERFTDVQLTRKYPHTVKYTKDTEGKYMLNAQGHIKYDIIPDFELNPDGSFPMDPPNGAGNLTEEQYNREYRVQFMAGTAQAFPEFSYDNNVISYDALVNSHYFQSSNTVGGYDQGIANSTIIDIKGREGKSSASCIAKVLCIKIPYTDQYQYVIYDVQYLANPVAPAIAHNWLEFLKANIPIVAENALWITTLQGGIKPFNQILNADRDLLNDKRSFTDRGIFKCFKRTWQNKFDDLNNWFKSTEFKPKGRTSSVKFINPIYPTIAGRKLYITDNCRELIKYFSELTLDLNTTDNSRKPGKMRSDQFDAATYPIDLIEYKEINKKDIEKFWLHSSSWNGNNTKNQFMSSGILYDMLYSQKKRGNNRRY